MQNLKCKVQKSRSRIRKLNFKLSRKTWLTLCILHFAFCISCSVPNLEQAECTESRGVVKEFYSYHFGNEMKFTPENLQPREKFLTAELTKLLRRFVTESDPFTLTTNDAPKAFSVSGCKVIDANKVEVRVLLFWRDDARSEQKEIHAEVVRQNGKWLIDNIYNDQINLQDNLNH